jgi:hypothetical protein
MKKTPLKRRAWLKRGGPIKRRSPAKDGKPAPYHRLIRSKPFSQLKPKAQLRGGQLKGRKPMKQRSAKRVREEREYSALRKKFLGEIKYCEPCHAAGRTRTPSTQCHHMAGRGRFYLRVDTWLAVCHDCHQKITDNRTWAEAHNYSLTVAQRRAL